MNHSEVEELLASYALDAVEGAEAAALDEHLDDCQRCRAALARHRELASLFAASAAEAPPELWERISACLAEPGPEYVAPAPASVVPLRGARAGSRRRLAAGGIALVALAAALLAVVLAVRLSNLEGQVGQLRAAVRAKGLSAAVSAALVAPHEEVVLSSATSGRKAEVVLTPGGEGYWVGSNLPSLGSGRTYQLWALVRGEPVSIGLLGPDPSRFGAFRVEKGFSALMVTAEPAGGTAAPTTRVLVSRTMRS